jgi:hypothetical protein
MTTYLPTESASKQINKYIKTKPDLFRLYAMLGATTAATTNNKAEGFPTNSRKMMDGYLLHKNQKT